MHHFDLKMLLKDAVADFFWFKIFDLNIPVQLHTCSYLCITFFDTIPLRNKRCPIIVDLPASTWPITTILSCCLEFLLRCSYSFCKKILNNVSLQNYNLFLNRNNNVDYLRMITAKID